ncbi:hypothetical protein [Gottfriedia luciferensis]|uniref:hypothetical protein n=1 Tax=Gottfriedia luciferensis TaxID=178774 RepID=UPI000B44ADDB|nr:hypothetical protein [Gottfriedia luciferensis]
MDLFLGFMVIYIDPILLALFFANSVALLKKIKNNERTLFNTVVGSIMFSILVITFYLDSL